MTTATSYGGEIDVRSHGSGDCSNKDPNVDVILEINDANDQPGIWLRKPSPV